MPAIRTLVPESREREPEEGRMILVASVLRAFWSKRYMKVGLEGFHKTALFIQAQLMEKGEDAGFTYDKQSRCSPEVQKALDALMKKRFFSIEWNGEEDEIAFNADTGKRLLALLQEMNLEAPENKTILPLCGKAVDFYTSLRTRKTGCDQ